MNKISRVYLLLFIFVVGALICASINDSRLLITVLIVCCFITGIFFVLEGE